MNTCAKSQTVWVTDPEALLKLDPTDPDSVSYNTRTTDACLDMVTQGWIKVGTAEILYTLDRTPEDLNADALAQLHAAEQKLQADTEVKLNALREMRSKLQALSWNGEAA